MRRNVLTLLGVIALVAAPAMAGEWHSGTNNLCSDCHTMHFSMQHNFDSSGTPSTTPAPNGNWMGATGPNAYLLKLPPNELCMACHDGQTFAPDVVEANTNASPTQGRMAGAVNHLNTAPYEDWKGHTLDSVDPAPGNDGAASLGGAWVYAGPLECISCHAQHGPTASYRNLGPYSMSGITGLVRPTYTISTTFDPLADVTINLASYTANSGNAATFNPFYDFANIAYSRNDGVAGVNQSSNSLDNLCAACHGLFHGAELDTGIGGSGLGDQFLRHPTAATSLGVGHGHSDLSRFQGAVTKTKVYASDQATFADASPGCVSCHKAHGNQNPFGLFYLNRNAVTVTEEGGWDATQPQDLLNGYRNLCGQCHGQGN